MIEQLPEDPCSTPADCEKVGCLRPDACQRAAVPEQRPSKPLCKHDWVGDDHCAYCRAEDAEADRDRLQTAYDQLHADLKQLGDPLALERLMQERDRLREALVGAQKWMNQAIGRNWETHDTWNPSLWDQIAGALAAGGQT